MDDICFQSAKNIAELIRKKKISSEEVVKMHIKRIEKVNPKLNAIVQFYPEEALKLAREADQSKKKGLLHGVPFTVKDMYRVKDKIITMGTTGLSNHKAEMTSTLVERLRNAGAILLGITNVPEAGWAFESTNLVYGQTNNPYDLKRTPGGSSGGESAIIAAGGSPLGLGSDFAGSIRVPAHFSGIAGIRPTVGRLSCSGIINYPIGLRSFFLAIGPMSRFVEDLIYTMPILSGVDWRDSATQPVSLRDPAKVKLKKLKVAYFIDNTVVTPTNDTINVLKEAVAILAKAVESVTEDRPESVSQSFDLFERILDFDAAELTLEAFKRIGTKEVSPIVQSLFNKFPKKPYSIHKINDLYSEWFQFRSSMLKYMENYDVLINPVNPYPAMKHNTSFDKYSSFGYTMTHSLTGWPSVVVRCGTSKEGLPIGLEIGAKPWREDIALAVAAFLERKMGGWQKPNI